MDPLLRRLYWLPIVLLLLAGCAPGAPEPVAPAPGGVPLGAAQKGPAPGSDAQAIEIARKTLDAMGGPEAWARTRYVSWRFFARRLHYWDRQTGDIRIEVPASDERAAVLLLMNLNSRKGRAWEDGAEVVDPARLAELTDIGYQLWVNDAYWMFMPYKLLDPGVVLRYAGERAMEDGREADVLDLTFTTGTGLTPRNRYEVFVARDTGLVGQWAYYREADGEVPDFTSPWSGWEQFGSIRLATYHGRGVDWEIAVHNDLPPSVFRDPAPVAP